VVRLLFLQALRIGDGSIRIERIDFVERRGRSGRQNQLFCAGFSCEAGRMQCRCTEHCAKKYRAPWKSTD